MADRISNACAALGYLWQLDGFIHRHPRMLVQVAFSLQMTAYFNLRREDVLSVSDHRSEGLCWKDVSLFLLARPGTTHRAAIAQLAIRRCTEQDDIVV
jgi:hypothetical protein